MTNWDITKALFLAPIKGAVFCMFLPFIGIAMLGWYGLQKLGAGMRRRAKRSTTTIAGVV